MVKSDKTTHSAGSKCFLFFIVWKIIFILCLAIRFMCISLGYKLRLNGGNMIGVRVCFHIEATFIYSHACSHAHAHFFSFINKIFIYFGHLEVVNQIVRPSKHLSKHLAQFRFVSIESLVLFCFFLFLLFFHFALLLFLFLCCFLCVCFDFKCLWSLFYLIFSTGLFAEEISIEVKRYSFLFSLALSLHFIECQINKPYGKRVHGGTAREQYVHPRFELRVKCMHLVCLEKKNTRRTILVQRRSIAVCKSMFRWKL